MSIESFYNSLDIYYIYNFVFINYPKIGLTFSQVNRESKFLYSNNVLIGLKRNDTPRIIHIPFPGIKIDPKLRGN